MKRMNAKEIAAKIASVVNKMVEERKVVAEGLELGLTLQEMKFACRFLGTCDYEFEHSRSERITIRKEYCHNALNYKICGAYKN